MNWLTVFPLSLTETVYAGIALSVCFASCCNWPVCSETPAATLQLEPARAKQLCTDWQGEPLPEGARTRLGSSRLRSGGAITALAFSSDGKLIASGGVSGVFLWDVQTGKCKWRYDVHRERILDITFIDGSTLLIAVGAGLVDLRSLDLANGTLAKRVELRLDGQPDQLTIAADGRNVVTNLSKAIQLYDATTGNEKRRLQLQGMEESKYVALCPDGRTIGLANGTDTIRVIDLATGQVRRVLKRQGAHFMIVALSEDGHWVAGLSCKGGWGESVSIWDRSTTGEKHRLTAEGAFDLHLGFSPNNALLLTAGQQGDFTLWDMVTGKQQGRNCKTRSDVKRIAFSPQGKLIALASDEGLTLWDVVTGRLLPSSVDPPLPVRELRFSQDGTQVFGTSDVIRTWDAASGRELRRSPDVPHGDSIVLSPDGTLLATKDDATIQLLDNASGTKLRTLKARNHVSFVQFSADSRNLFTGEFDQTLSVWDVATGREVRKLEGRGFRPYSPLAVSPDGQWLAGVTRSSGPKNCIIHLWDLTHAKEVKRLEPRLELFALVFSPDSQFLAAAGSDKNDYRATIQTWKSATGSLWRTLKGHQGTITCLTFSGDVRMLASGGDSKPYASEYDVPCLWELTTGKERYQFAGQRGPIHSVAFSPDGKLLAASSPEAPVFIWELTATQHAPGKLSPAEFNRCWMGLADDDAKVAFRAIQRLACCTDQTVSFIEKRLSPVSSPELQRLQALLRQLESPRFVERRKAKEDLERLGELAEPLLRKAMAGHVSPDLGRQIEQLIAKLNEPSVSSELLQAIRAVEVLEYIPTSRSEQLLKTLARGTSEARLTKEARGALDRRSSHKRERE